MLDGLREYERGEALLRRALDLAVMVWGASSMQHLNALYALAQHYGCGLRRRGGRGGGGVVWCGGVGWGAPSPLHSLRCPQQASHPPAAFTHALPSPAPPCPAHHACRRRGKLQKSIALHEQVLGIMDDTILEYSPELLQNRIAILRCGRGRPAGAGQRGRGLGGRAALQGLRI